MLRTRSRRRWTAESALAPPVVIAALLIGCGDPQADSDGGTTQSTSTTGDTSTDTSDGTATESGTDSTDTTTDATDSTDTTGTDETDTGDPDPCGDEVCADMVMSEGLVAYYSFTGNADDSSGNAHHGVVDGAVLAADRHGNPDCAYAFDGTDDLIRVSSTQMLDIHDAITLIAWKKHDSNQNTQDVINKLPESVPFGNYGGYRLSWWSANPTGNAFSLYETGNQNIAYPNAYDDYQSWNQLAASWDGTTMRLYENGTEVASTPFSGTISSSAGNLYIGVTALSGSGADVPSQGWFHGQIDEVAIYDRAWSEQEIQDLYACQSDEG